MSNPGAATPYRDGYIVQNIDCTPGSEHIEFNQGRFLELGLEIGGVRRRPDARAGLRDSRAAT